MIDYGFAILPDTGTIDTAHEPYASYLDAIEPTDEEIDAMEWEAEEYETEGEYLSLLYFEEI
jgi:hypothetical protein